MAKKHKGGKGKKLKMVGGAAHSFGKKHKGGKSRRKRSYKR